MLDYHHFSKVNYLIVFMLGIGFISSESAWSHHSTMTSRAGGQTPLLSSSWSSLKERRYFETGLRLERSTWRSLSDRSEINLGSLDAQLIKFSQRYRWSKHQDLSLILPIGRFHRYAQSGMKTSQIGLSDIELNYQQSIITFGQQYSMPFTLAFAVGIIAPTGRYSPENTLSDTKLIPQSNGAINRYTFNAQTSLGADTWSTSFGLYNHWKVLPTLSITQGMGVSLPLTKTRDQITWGSDLSTRLGLTWWVWSEGAIEFAGRWLRHLSDQINATEPPNQTQRVGGRQQLNVELNFSVAIHRQLRCHLGATLTPWIKVDSPQLVQESHLKVGCYLSWGDPIN